MKNKKYIKEPYNKRKEIQNILDTNYFYTKVNIGKDRSVIWTVFYDNLPANTYYPKVNTRVLSSKNDSIQDIYNLKRKFEYEKNRTFQNNLNEFISLKKIITVQLYRIKKLHMKLSIWLLIPILIASIINIIKYKNDAIGIFFSILVSTLVVIIIWQQINMDKYIDKELSVCRERFIKDKLQRQGVWFLNKLRD